MFITQQGMLFMATAGLIFASMGAGLSGVTNNHIAAIQMRRRTSEPELEFPLAECKMLVAFVSLALFGFFLMFASMTLALVKCGVFRV
jgi:hypothetical protein